MPPPDEPREVRLARLLNALRFDEAERRLAAWLAESPADMRGRATFAKLRMMQGRFPEAHALYAALAADAPATASFHACAAQAASESGLDAEAVAAFERAIALKPANPYYLKLLERHHLKRGDPGRAAAPYQAILARDPEDLNALLALGTLCSARAEPDAAALLERACRVAPDLARPWLSLGGERARWGEGAEAEAAFARGVAFDLAEQCAREAREKRVSLFPCLDLLHHAGLLALGLNDRLGPALAAFTRKQAAALADPRTFHDIAAIDSLHLEYSYEEALAFRRGRLAAAGGGEPLFAEARALGDAARALDPGLAPLEGLNLRREFDRTLARVAAAKSPGAPSRLAAVVACAERRAFEAARAFDPGRSAGGTLDPSARDAAAHPAAGHAAAFFFALLEAALGHCALRGGEAADGRARIARAADRFAAFAGEPGFPWPAAAALGEAWAAQFLGDYDRSNRRYLDHLAADPDLSHTRLLAVACGWFLMQ